MNKKLTLKSLLVASLMAMGSVSAWATEVTATLLHTAAVQGGSNTAETSLDEATHYYNNWGTSGWAAQAYIGFTAEIPTGEAITKATLKFTSNAARGNRSLDVCAKDGTNFDYEKLELIAKSAAGISVVTLSENATKSLKTVDVTDAVKEIYDNGSGSSNFLFVLSNAAAGGTLQGKASAEAPSLVIETANASTQTTYTVKFVDADGTKLKDAVTYDATIGDKANASAADKESFKNADGTKKYVYVSGADEITVAAEAASNVITLVFREAATVGYKLKDSTSGEIVREGSAFEGESVTVGYPRYILKDGVLYDAPKQGSNPWYGVSITLGTSDVEQTIAYTKTETVGIVYAKEGEDIVGATSNKGANYADIRSYGCAAGYAAQDIVLITLQAGKYVIKADLFTPTSALGSQTFLVGEKEYTLTSTGNGYHNELQSEEFELTEETTVTWKAGGGATNAIDWMYIWQVPEVYNYTVNAVDESKNVLFEVAKGSVYKGQNATAIYPAFYLKGSELLQADRINDNKKQYQYTFAVEADNDVKEITYKSVGLNDVVYYSEAENIEGLTAVSSGNAPIRCSNGKGAIAETDAMITSLEAGRYTISAFAWGNTGATFDVYAGENKVASYSSAASTLSINRSDIFELTEAADIVVKAAGEGGNNPKVLDYIFIQKVPASITVDFGAEDFMTFSSATYPLDFSTATGVNAYVATKAENGLVTMTKVTGAVAANTGLLLQKTGETVAIPVATTAEAVAENLLKAANGGKVAASAEGTFHYVFAKQAGVFGFYKLTEDKNVAKGKAYLETAADFAPAAGARILFANEATGITAVEAVETQHVLYNLAGQRVAKAQKGINIVNGKKYIVK